MSKKIKILYTIPNFDTAGSGIPLLKIANNLDKNIFEPQIACLHDKGALFKDVQRSGIKFHIIDLYKNARPIFKMLKECFQLSRVFKKINPHIIHSYHYGADYTEAIAAKMAGIKWIYTKKNMSWKGSSYRGWKLRSFLASGIICQNTDMLSSFFPNLRKATLIPIGVDIEEFRQKAENKDFRKQWDKSGNARFIVSVANLVPVKGIEILIQAFERLAPAYPDWKLLIIGDDTTEYGVGLKKLSKKQNLKAKVIFTGRQNNVREFLDISEIYVQPTLFKGRMEGAPIAIQEAMANGKLILGSNIPGIKDQLREFPNHLFQPGNIIDLRNKLIQFISNTVNENKEIGNKFVDFVADNYDLSIEKKHLQSFYFHLVNNID